MKVSVIILILLWFFSATDSAKVLANTPPAIPENAVWVAFGSTTIKYRLTFDLYIDPSDGIIWRVYRLTEDSQYVALITWQNKFSAEEIVWMAEDF